MLIWYLYQAKSKNTSWLLMSMREEVIYKTPIFIVQTTACPVWFFVTSKQMWIKASHCGSSLMWSLRVALNLNNVESVIKLKNCTRGQMNWGGPKFYQFRRWSDYITMQNGLFMGLICISCTSHGENGLKLGMLVYVYVLHLFLIVVDTWYLFDFYLLAIYLISYAHFTIRNDIVDNI